VLNAVAARAVAGNVCRHFTAQRRSAKSIATAQGAANYSVLDSSRAGLGLQRRFRAVPA